MEDKLKALKVVQLKEILTKSGTQIPPKANKADLIAKVLATPAALELAGGSSTAEAAEPAATGGDDDLLAPPDEFDWEGGADAKGAAPAEAAGTATTEAEPAPTTEAAAASTTEAAGEPASATATSAAPDPETATSEAPKSDEDVERERRKARAARFGIPYVEPAAAPAAKTPKPPRPKGKADPPVKQGKKIVADTGKAAEGGAGNKKTEGKKVDEPKPPRIGAKEAAPNDDDAKLAARAARFGISTPAAAPAAAGSSADPADEEKRKKREARFGAPSAKKAKTDT